ncbi:MAG: mechanosensitive ion channel family protein [Thermacetogeniaceae bacterium]
MDGLSALMRSFSEGQLAAYGRTLGHILLIVVLMALAWRLGRRLIDGLLRPERLPGGWDERRVRTVQGLLRSLLRYTIYFVGAMMVLGELGVKTESILAGAGIIGLAVGFGAQNLVRDVISGFFILFEDQYAVGDYVSVANVTGTVEEIGLRVTKLREPGGQLHIIPNGEIKIVTNFSRGGIAVDIEVTVAYEEDISRATEVINEVCRRVSEGNPAVLEEPRVLGVKKLGRLGVTLQVFGKVKPMEQWSFARELRKGIKEALDAAGIRRPDPRRIILFSRDSGRGEEGDGSDAV